MIGTWSSVLKAFCLFYWIFVCALFQILSRVLIFFLNFSPTSDGSAAAILCSEDFVKRNNLQSKAVEIIAMEMRTDFPSTFNEKSGMKLVRKDVRLIELYVHWSLYCI